MSAVVYGASNRVIGWEASADLSSDQYKFVELDGSQQLAVCNAAGDFAFGVLQDKPAAQGRVGEVVLSGATKIVAGAAITKGALITTDNAGRAVTVGPTGGGDTNKAILGRALTSAGAANDLIGAIINCVNPGPAT